MKTFSTLLFTLFLASAAAGMFSIREARLVGEKMELESVLRVVCSMGELEQPSFEGDFTGKITVRAKGSTEALLNDLCAAFGVSVDLSSNPRFARITANPASRSIDPPALGELPPIQIVADQVALASVLHMLASAAEQDFFFDPGLFEQPITLHGQFSPWVKLEELCKDHRIQIVRMKSGWFFRPESL